MLLTTLPRCAIKGDLGVEGVRLRKCRGVGESARSVAQARRKPCELGSGVVDHQFVTTRAIVTFTKPVHFPQGFFSVI
jgi:hypothetical protein